MSMIEKIMRNEKKSKRFFGLNHQQIMLLLSKLQPLWIESEKRRLSRTNRKRSIGGGRQHRPDASLQSLLVCLVYYKLYLTQEFTAALFDIDQSTVSRIVSKFSALIADAADPELGKLIRQTETLKKNRIKNFVELQEACPDFADVITDASESPCNRPQDNDVQRKFYSGKQKAHTIKTQITINTAKKIVLVSESHPGSVHDKKILDMDGTIDKLPEKARHMLDKGYVGVDREHPNSNILIPIKKKRGQKELPPIAKQINTFISKHRIKVEHVIGKIKNFRICSYTYRGPRDRFNQIFKNIAAIYNFTHTAA